MLVVRGTHLLVVLAACGNFGYPTPPPPLVARPAEVAPPVAARVELEVIPENTYRSLVKDDPRLAETAGDLSRYADANGEVDDGIAEQLLRVHGIVDPVQHVAIAATEAELDALFHDEQNHSNARWASSPTKEGVVGILVYATPIQLADVPRSGEHFTFKGTFPKHDISAPRVTVDGKRHLGVDATDSDWKAELACPSPGKHDVAIEATDPKLDFIPMVIFPVYCGVVPSKVAGEPRANLEAIANANSQEAQRFAHQMIAILDRERARVDLPALHSNVRLQRATDAMLDDHLRGIESEFPFHLHRASLLTPDATFTKFHVTSLARAVSRILDDEAQHAKLIDGHNSDAAIAVRIDDKGYWVGVAYMVVPPPLDLPVVKDLFAKKITAFERKRFEAKEDVLPNVRESAYLSGPAQGLAVELAKGWGIEQLAAEFRRGYSFGLVTDSTDDIYTYDIAALAKKNEMSRFGLGIAQAPADSAFAGRIFIVIVFAPVAPAQQFRALRGRY
ncbi:MAG TPA: hypothetical protein VGC41_16680 [Kofleriaceae bacterium]